MKISNRQLKIANLVNQALVDIFLTRKNLDKQLVDCNITVTNVMITSDLKIANCYLLPFGSLNNLSKEEFIEAIERSKYAIRTIVTKKLNLRYSIMLKFYYDYGFDNADYIHKILNKLQN